MVKVNVKVMAHRGFSSKFPENTLVAFEMALEHRVESVGFDVVYLTAADRLVAGHDPTVDRTTNGTGEAAALTFVEPRSLEASVRKGPRAQNPPSPHSTYSMDERLRLQLKTNDHTHARLTEPPAAPQPGEVRPGHTPRSSAAIVCAPVRSGPPDVAAAMVRDAREAGTELSAFADDPDEMRRPSRASQRRREGSIK